MHALQTNYYFRISVIHYPRLQTTLMITPPKQHRFQILNQNKEAKRELVEQQTKSILPLYFDSNKYGVHTECY